MASKIDKDKAVALKEQGKTYTEIAARHNRVVDNLRENCNQKTYTTDFSDLEHLMY